MMPGTPFMESLQWFERSPWQPLRTDWTQVALVKGCAVISDGLACFRAVAEVGCVHQPVIVKGRHPNELPEFRWINTVLSNLKTSFNGTFHALRFAKYSDRYWVPSAIGSIGDSIWQR